MIMNHEQLEHVAAVEWRNLDEMLEKKKLCTSHYFHRKVYEIVKRILIANQSKEINAIQWEVNVVESDEVNAFVLANGQMFLLAF